MFPGFNKTQNVYLLLSPANIVRQENMPESILQSSQNVEHIDRQHVLTYAQKKTPAK